jgi:leader peptidase (prepilin peptidase)/N-methyltransferase
MYQIILYPLLFIYGTAIGSFLNVLIDRLPNEESIMGRSHCDYCKKKLNGLDLFPIFSFLFLKGRCRYCKKKLSYFYPFVELLTGAAFILTWIYFPVNGVQNNLLPIPSDIIVRIIAIGIVSTLIVIIFADLKYKIIPDSMQVAFFIFSLLIHIFQGVSASDFINYILSGLAIMSPILFLFLVTHGRGMGFGDVKLAAIFGFLLGLKGGLLVLYIAFLSGGIIGAVLLLGQKKGMKSTIAFGPYLVLGIIIILFFGKQINMALYQFYGL